MTSPRVFSNRSGLQRPSNQFSLTLKVALILCVSAAVFSTACQQQQQTTAAPDNRASDEATLRDWDANWSKAASAKDVDKTVSYYADDAIVMPPNAPPATKKADVRKIWNDTLTSPGFSGGWKATKIDVARSGELATISGTWEFKWNDAKGKPTSDRGKFVEVDKKQPDGSWKCVTDIWNSDLPPATPATSK